MPIAKRWSVAVALAALSATGSAVAQRLPVTETEALSYILSAFISQADPAVMKQQVSIGPELEKRLELASGAEGTRVYRALVGLTDGKPLEVRKATPEELEAYGARRGFDRNSGHAFYTLDAGSLRFLVQYDLQSARIPFVGQLGVPDPDPPAPVALRTAGSQSPAPKPTLLNLTWTGLFEYNSATLTAEARAKLDEIVPKVAQLGNIRYLHVSGHSDRIGSPEVNQRLSEKRAEAVRDYLVAKGVSADTIEVFGYGKTLPIKSCPQDASSRSLIECLAPNRRVVMELQAQPQ